MQTADAVVIGAGPNGLVAANLLADAGWSVIVLEEQGEPGGAVRTAPVTAPGFRNDLFSAFYPFAVAPSPIADLELERYGLRWRRSPNVLTHVTPDGRSVTLSTDLEATEASVAAWSASDGARWRRAYREWLELEHDLLATLLSPFPPVRCALGLVRRTGVAGAVRLARRLLLPSARLGRELFGGDGARLLLSGLALHSDVGVTNTASGGYGYIMAMLGQHYGFPVPEGGAGCLTAALVDRLHLRGGEVICHAAARRIEVRHGVARRVHTADGRVFRARRAVLADVAVTALYHDLLDPSLLPGRLRADLADFEYDPATVKVDWALSGPVPWDDPEPASSGTVHIGPDLDGLARSWSALEAGQVPEQPFLVCGQMTTADPTRSPAGTQSFWAYTRLPRRPHWSDGDLAGVVDRIEAVLQAAAPGFGARVIARHVAGPAELARQNANLVGGALAGGTNAIHQQLFLRPVPGLGRADTPIDRLYLASASAHPGGGVHGGPGANAARAALARSRFVRGPLYRGAVQVAQRRVYPT